MTGPLIYCHGNLVATKQVSGRWFCLGCGDEVRVVW
jgi:hypothetical protein